MPLSYMEWLEQLEDTPDNRLVLMEDLLYHNGNDSKLLFSDDAYPFLAHIRKADQKLWLSHLWPVMNVWPKERRTAFNKLLDEQDGGGGEASEQIEAVPFETFSAEELRVENVPDTRWIVKDLLPEGLASLAGRPKQGKSWLALNLAIAVAMGGKALGDYDIPAEGDVLFLALEDNKSRLKKRMNQLMRQVIPWPERLKFSIFSPRVGAGFTETLRLWLESKANPTLVVVDMYTKIAKQNDKKSSNGGYDDIYDELGALQELAYEFHIAMLMVMHLNKNTDVENAVDRIMGSTAFSGATVTNLVLQRNTTGEPSDAILSPSGKDLENQDDIALVFDRGIWSSRGDADAYNQSYHRLELLQAIYIGKGTGTTPKDLADAVGKNDSTIRTLLSKLRDDGLVRRDKGNQHYTLTIAGAEVIKAHGKDEGRSRNLDKFEGNEYGDKNDDTQPWTDDADTIF